MKKRLPYFVLSVVLVAAVALTSFTYAEPAEAQNRVLCVRMPDGRALSVTVPVVAGVPINVPGVVVDASECQPKQPAPATPPPTTPAPAPAPTAPAAPKPGAGQEQERGGSKKAPTRGEKKRAGKKGKGKNRADSKAKAEIEGGAEDRKSRKGKRKNASRGIRNPDGSPTPSNPGFVDALPGPSTASGVPNFVIRKFRVPVFLLPIYQAAGIQYGVRWEILAAINEIETDYGRNLNVSSAGALGWMQFIPSSWRMYGTDANKDGKKDPYNPVDAIFAAARYLKAAGYEKDVRRSIFAYNHADWYV
ncbi:MAG TPA: lytic transglycosylase domain-containing protein, partial [Thermoleophilaceae bacterium]|nr:lytic transglycosylase domain-containing protein [Thermoleophilaceae bacterium]